jgi:tRNA threonylcarbamoyladenosine biosynthesis protein TsaB
VIGGDGSSLIKPKVAPIAEALDAAHLGAPHLVGNAAKILAERWPADAAPPFRVDQQAAPDIAWVAWLGAAVNPESSPARPYYLRAPDAKPSKDLLSGAAQPPASR